MQHNRSEIYTTLLKDYQSKLESLRKQSKYTALGRLLVFVGGLGISLALIINGPLILGYVLLLLFIIIFLRLMLIDKRLHNSIRITEKLCEINKIELNALNYEYLEFDAGNEYTDYDHDYSYDLDVFGPGSLFQYVNRTVTAKGRNLLAQWIMNNETDNNLLIQKQNAIKDLSTKTNLRQHFWATGKQIPLDKDNNQISKLVSDKSSIFLKKIFAATLYTITSFTLLSLSLLMIGLIPYQIFSFLFVLQLSIVAFLTGRINQEYKRIDKLSKTLSYYAQLASIIEKEEFESSILDEIKNNLSQGNLSASKQIAKLSSIAASFDARSNILATIFRNGLYMGDIWLMIRFLKWEKQNLPYYNTWIENISQLDAYNSLATYAYNNPDYTYPAFESTYFKLNAENIGHPLIPSTERVSNNFQVNKSGEMYVLTGANMSGKSTFLRTVGINMTLAMAGAPVCATVFTFTPVKLKLCVRAKDNLKKRESYFYAELIKIKRITDSLRNGQQIFVILDEILRGTNSKDKYLGTYALIENLTSKNVPGIVATHDLQISEMANEIPEKVKNICFEVTVDGEKLHFDYKLRNGVCQNLNALHLMRNMGIITQK